MYDYEKEKTLEERQAEELELKLERNRRNREYVRQVKVINTVSIILAILSIIAFIICLKFFSHSLIAIMTPIIVFYIIYCTLGAARKRPHCDARMFERWFMRYIGIGFWMSLFVDRCPHCGVSLRPSASLTAIEERREREKAKNPQ